MFILLTGLLKSKSEDPFFFRVHAHNKTLFRHLADFSLEERKYRVTTYKKFLFTRNPFDRVISAYKDRFLDPSNLDLQQLLGTEIIRRYRPANQTSKESLIRGHDVTFVEFIRYLTDRDNPRRMSNVHWRPVYNLCYPCQLNYTFIGHYETLNEDAGRILSEIGAPNLHFPEQQPHVSNASSLLASYMRLLTRQQIQALYNEYERDFEIFGYDQQHLL